MYFPRTAGSNGANALARRESMTPKETKPAARRDPKGPPKKEPPPSPETPTTADEKMDGEVQAGTLIAASAQGVPFCEECEKRKKKVAS